MFRCLSCLPLLWSAAFGQSAETPAAFEAADIHASAHVRYPYMRGPLHHGDRYELRDANMVDLIAAAYGVKNEKVVGGPSWLELDRFDVIAKAPADATPETLKPLLQALLADRFKLVVHKDTKPIPAYALTAGKHSGLKKSDGTGETGCKVTRPGPGTQVPGLPAFTYSCHNVTMAALAEQISGSPAEFMYLNQESIMDQTGLEGGWDFSFKYTFRGGPRPNGEVITIFDAVDKQLGLKLYPSKIPLPVIMVDGVNRKPTDNLPGVAEALHEAPPPTEFEVADLKPTSPDFRGMRFQVQPGGRVNFQGVTLQFMINQAWDITNEMIVGAPKWLTEDRYDLVAKAPSEGGEMNYDEVMPLIRALLAERFKLKVHNEDKLMPAYTLLATKPKLKQADPSERTKYQEGPAADGKDPRNTTPVLSRLVTIQNMTMAQFAAELQGIASGYIHSPVLDATKLEGAWDLTLSFSPAGVMGGRGGGGRGGDAGPLSATPDASDPTGGVSLFEAIEKLGLKLDLQKRMVPVLVIDHIEQKPTEN